MPPRLEAIVSSLLLVCSVDLEAAPMVARLGSATTRVVGRRAAVAGRLAGRPVLVVVGGMGKVNAAQAVTAAIEAGDVAQVIGFGVGGAYPGSGLSVGQVALADREIYGDEGVEAPDGWISTEGIGIPLVEAGGRRLFNEIPLDAARVGAAAKALRAAGVAARTGPFVTVSACSGTTRRGEVLAKRFGAVCESMEGAAYAHVAALYGLPFLEVRGISNRVEDRDLSGWRLEDAAAAAARAVERVASRSDP